MEEGDFPGVGISLEERRFQPLSMYCPGSVGDAAIVNISDPCGVTADVDVGLGHVPLVVFAGGAFGFDEGDDGIRRKSFASVVHIEVPCDEGIEFREIVIA